MSAVQENRITVREFYICAWCKLSVDPEQSVIGQDALGRTQHLHPECTPELRKPADETMEIVPGEITVGVEGGIVQWILGIPEGITVRVIDYDVEDSDEHHELVQDRDGDTARASVWRQTKGD